MKNETLKQARPEAAFSAEYLDTLSLLHLANEAGWIKSLARVAACYNLFEKEKYREAGITRKEYLGLVGLSERSYYRYKKTGHLMKLVCLKILELPADAQFLFTREMIETCFGAYFTEGRELTINQLSANSISVEVFERFLRGEADVTDKKVEELIEGRVPKDALNVIQAPTRTTQRPVIKPESDFIRVPHPIRPEENLFSGHEKIINAGFSWDKENEKYLNPDQSEMTVEQLAEFVDTEMGLKIFEEVRNVVAPARREVVLRIGRLRIFLLACTSKHKSPKFTQLVREKHIELEEEVLGLLHEVTLMVKEDVD